MEIINIISQIASQENIFTFLFIGLFLWQMKSHQTELNYYKDLVKNSLTPLIASVNEIKEIVNDIKEEQI